MGDPLTDQLDAARRALDHAIEPSELLGRWLYGSAVHGGLRPDSDLDLFVLTARPLREAEKRALVAGLLPISGRETRPASWRPLEVTVVARPDLDPWRYPPRLQLQYGEWLRDPLLEGVEWPWPEVSPDLAILVAMVRDGGRPLLGPPADEILAPVPMEDIVAATLDEIPALLEDLADDTRNVLLTLARMWSTVATGTIRPKDAAADWVLDRLPPERRPVVAEARDLYRRGGFGTWDRTAVLAADALVEGIRAEAARRGR